MASVAFHHGSRVFESAETPLLVRMAQTAVIGLIGTAPDADEDKFPLNKPVQLLRTADHTGLGATGTLQDALDSIYDRIGCPIILVRIEEGSTIQETWGNAVGSQASFSGVHAFRRARSDGLHRPKLLIAPGLTQTGPADGIASINVTTAGSGYDQSKVTVALTGGAGSGATARAVVGLNGGIDAIVVTNPGYGYTSAPTVAINGNGSGTGAAATANIGSTMNPVVAELMGVADALRAMVYVDGPDTTDQAAVQYRGKINSQRVFVCDPKVLKFDTQDDVNVPQPSSPVWAAGQAYMDLTQGFHWAGSNIEVPGIVGVNRPVEYGPQSDYLNENRVNTMVNIDNTGFRLWGVWTCATDPMWQFVSVRRTADAINEALEAAYLEFVDKPFSLANLKHMVEGGRSFLRLMEAEGYILPGSDVWLLDTNTKEEMAQGIVKLGVRIEPPAPMVDIRLTAHRNIVAYELLLNQVAQEINALAIAA